MDGLARADNPVEPAIRARKNCSFHQLRYVFLLFSGIATGLMMVLRLSITVAMIGMVNHTQIYIDENLNATAQEIEDNFHPGYIENGEFAWNHEIQETIITCYMVTYTLFPIVITRGIMKYGLKNSISTLLLLCAVITIVTPTMAYWSWKWLVLLRLILGAASCGIVPGMVRLIELWTPTKEAATGHLAQIDWKLVFYVPGIVTLIFCIIWWIIVADGPTTSRLLSQKEFDHIMEVSANEQEKSNQKKQAEKSEELEWLFMFKVKEFWYLAFIWCLYCATSGSMIYLLPTYLHMVLKVSVQDVGIYTFLVQIGSLFSMLWPNSTANLFMKMFKCSLTTARRLVTSICIFIATTTILYLAAYHQFIVVVICIHRFFHMTHDTIYLGTVLSNFGPSGTSGPVYSMLNSFGCINSTIFCIIVGKYLDYTGGVIECWSWVFVAMAIMNMLYFLVYCVLCHSRPVEIKSKRLDGSDEGVKAN